MTIKKFLAIWEVLRHFKSIFSTSLWMLIPGINITVALNYAGRQLNPLINNSLGKMVANFNSAYDDAINGTKEYWTALLSESILSLTYAFLAFAMNNYAIHFLTTKFPEYAAAIPFATPDWVMYVGIALFIAVTAIIAHTLFGMLHAIYKAYTTMHPEYAKEPLPKYYLEVRAKAIAERDKVVKVPTAS